VDDILVRVACPCRVGTWVTLQNDASGTPHASWMYSKERVRIRPGEGENLNV